ncbi:hypothetical protein [Sulfobacillus harzensis]|uniref:Uncharacterized protein n=1 Tax=Sulfobacillus harzensis TaxID=2729629 RepID=A0A7Y0L3H8_9FIRM|nr:hypothetical protein [Sulfobacillus harzensis]NMP22031.1 hypothetical protein [Sulfobacillus harzensis]
MVSVIVFGASGILGAHVYRKLGARKDAGVQLIGTCGPISKAAGLVAGLLRDVRPDALEKERMDIVG